MTISEFITALKIQTSDAAVSGVLKTLHHPAGRKPRERDVLLSKWFCNLPECDQSMVKEVLRESAELAVFSFLTILDGVSVIEDGPEKGDVKLIYSRNGKEILLNDPNEELLHDAYNYLCQNSDLPELERSRNVTTTE